MLLVGEGEASMPRISQLFFKTAILFLIIGIGVGISMSITGQHSVMGAHAHINLVGWVTSAIFGVYYALNPAKAAGRLPLVHYGIYTVGVVIMCSALYFMLLGDMAMEPLVAAGSLITFAGVLMFAVIVFIRAPAGADLNPGAMPAE
jgi:drug/metabolite transporter superfamily protein YnfA